MPDQAYTFAAIDLGSNSFHMVVAEVRDRHMEIIDRAKEMVRLGAGLDEQDNLTPEAQMRALGCLERFGQRIRHLPSTRVRAVGTNTLRRADNSAEFLQLAEQALGHPIQIIAGREEARLIYLGVSHSLPESEDQRLVIDIGGGSTECIIGRHFNPLYRESLFMGCVQMSQRCFADGQISKKAMRQAQILAGLELQNITRHYRSIGWHEAIGASGTIRAIGEICVQQGWSREGISQEALGRLREALIDLGRVERLGDLTGLNPERAPSFPGGVAILSACFEHLGIERMSVSDWALREGVLYDILGRQQKEDVRERTIFRMQQRFRVDQEQAARIAVTALELYQQVRGRWVPDDEEIERHLAWAARLHEVGFAIAHNQYHKHGAYIVAHRDMPGFSRLEQQRLAALVRGHRRKIPLALFETLPESERQVAFRLCLILRLAVLLNRTRLSGEMPQVRFTAEANALQLHFPPRWLKDHPLSKADLKQERAYLRRAGCKLKSSDAT